MVSSLQNQIRPAGLVRRLSRIGHRKPFTRLYVEKAAVRSLRVVAVRLVTFPGWVDLVSGRSTVRVNTCVLEGEQSFRSAY